MTSTAAGAIGWASVHHGFTRAPRHLEGVARVLSGLGIASTRPHIMGMSPRHSMHDRSYLHRRAIERGVAAEIRGLGALPWIGIGHSAGGAMALHEAATRVDNGFPVAGVILLDGVDTISGIAEIPSVPILSVTTPPSACNAGGALVARIRREREGFIGLEVADGGHGDAERIGSRDPGRIPAVYRAVCRDSSTAGDVAIVESLLRAWSVDLALGRALSLEPGHPVVEAWARAGRVLPL